MIEESSLVTTIVVGIGLAFLLGAVANRFRVPPIVGYLLAGIVVGPFTPGYVANQNLAIELAEIGIILLMFGVGLHFSVRDLISVAKVAIPGALAQIIVASFFGFGLSYFLNWSTEAGLVFGLALSVSSTVVLLRTLQDRRLMSTESGHITVGWLIVQDLMMVLVLILLPSLANTNHIHEPGIFDLINKYISFGLVGIIILTVIKVIAFIGVMIIGGRRIIPWILHSVAHSGSHELFRLSVLAIALCVAYMAAQLFGVSMALGGFFAGMVLSESELSHQATQESLPLRDAFAVLFFVSVGMLFDPIILLRDPISVLATLFIIMIAKSFAAFLIALIFRLTVNSALIISVGLAQIGEFSFILAELGVKLKLLPEQAQSLILAGAILSILANPLMFSSIGWMNPRFEQWINKRLSKFSIFTDTKISVTIPIATMTNHVVLVGYGRIGSMIGNAFRQHGLTLLVIEDAEKVIAKIHQSGFEVIVGNATNSDILNTANLIKARHLIVTIPNVFEAGQIIMQARVDNPMIHIISCANSDAEIDHLVTCGADQVIVSAQEIANNIISSLLSTFTSDVETHNNSCN
ncbi:MAG: Kef family K(+) transporter [Rhodospirillaceae bacterium]|jgi:CPA2 family monovalent cation:H+ antiporter-2|nr:Kef family K(+) transporter [Rhodospirillaceae bacterium]